MGARRIRGAVLCPHCCGVIDPEEHNLSEGTLTWRCEECNNITDDGPGDSAICHHSPPEVVKEQCADCEAWQDPQDYRPRKQCPLCDTWVDPDYEDFDEDIEAFKCDGCDRITVNRDAAMTCCRD